MEKIFAAGKGARIINVSSLGYISGGKEAYNPWLAYAQSKTANILFASSLARRLKSRGVLAFALNPGYVTQEMFAEGYAMTLKSLDGAKMPPLVPKTLAEGSLTTIYAALDPTLTGHSGAFLSDCAIYTDLRDHAVGKEKEEKLWLLSEELVGERFNHR
ncbi:hypothetical protein V1507DRAFT_443522 [Lipomyces tetrasporus]